MANPLSHHHPTKVALYARVSTKNNGQDPETQLIALREYAQARGFQIVNEYVDVGISGSKDRRPELDRERAMMGLERARKQGKKLGRPATHVDADEIYQLRAKGLSLRNIAEALGVSHTLVARSLRAGVVRG